MIRTHIRPSRSIFQFDWREILEYRDLLGFLVLRDFTAMYKQSILGPLWFIIQPLATTIVFTIIFGHIANIGSDGLPYFLFCLSGTVLWGYFQGVMSSVSTSLIANANVMGKIYFPRLITPLSITISNLGQFLINFIIFIGFLLYYRFFTTADIHPAYTMIFFPLLILHTAVVGLGVGLWFSALTAKYRDLRFAIPFISQLWMFATPTIYPASKLVGTRWEILLLVNPMAFPIESVRLMFLGTGTVEPLFVGWGVMMGILLFITGLVLFNKVQRTFVDTI